MLIRGKVKMQTGGATIIMLLCGNTAIFCLGRPLFDVLYRGPVRNKGLHFREVFPISVIIKKSNCFRWPTF